MGKIRSVAALLGLTSKATEPPKEGPIEAPPLEADVVTIPPVLYQGVIPSVDKTKTMQITAREGVAMPKEEKKQPVASKEEPMHTPCPQAVLVNGKLINFDGALPLTERGLRACLLCGDRERIFLKSRGQVRQFHGGEAITPIPDDLEIFTRE